ncbi:urokinase plasminogen activator surface receptor-like [Chanodichthys erythropterus]|uniref:urokinase plasminogen activator surface receptor-like n=1 Tax=Chanodichthys erythropterus TaxID=933992 RepID=UPI00351E589A
MFVMILNTNTGHSLSCYECTGSCANQTVKTCPSGSSQCLSTTTVTQVGDTNTKVKIKGCASACQSGSLNIGTAKTTVSCCNTDQCNLQDAPDPVPNGKKCYSCDGKSCSNTLNCSGTEDRCVKATVTSGGHVVKGCASKSICDLAHVPGFKNVSCCEGNLCNGAQSVSQSFLFLCCSLLSYFLLH